jgi:L-malate glycosyltransferase
MGMTRPKNILHLHSSFNLGGKEARCAQIMNALGDSAGHVILSAEPDSLNAREALDAALDVTFPGDAAPALHGKPAPKRYLQLARYFRGFDLILSYNWGSMDGVMAHRMLSPFMALPPLIHHEDGFNEDEREGTNWKRDAFRRLALPTATRVIVPSQTLEHVARATWYVPSAKLSQIPNGIAVADYAAPPAPDAIPGLTKHDGEVWVGTLAGLRAVKNLPALVRATALAKAQGAHIDRLVIVGEGPERDAIESEAAACGIRHILHLPGFMRDPARFIGLFDIFALSSYSEQYPISLIEAMAAGVPAASFAVGDVANMIAPANAAFIVDAGDEATLAAALTALNADASRRRYIGKEAQALVRSRNDERVMLAKYATLYADAMGDPHFARKLRDKPA